MVRALAPADPAALSGVFLVTASDAAAVLELAAELPHLRHGGEVVVQRVLDTETPPPG